MTLIGKQKCSSIFLLKVITVTSSINCHMQSVKLINSALEVIGSNLYSVQQ